MAYNFGRLSRPAHAENLICKTSLNVPGAQAASMEGVVFAATLTPMRTALEGGA